MAPGIRIEAAEDFLASRYFVTSALVILFYDYLLCLSEEVASVWSSPLSLPIVLYYIVRYLPLVQGLSVMHWLAPTHSNSFCKIYGPTQLIAQEFAYIATTWLLAIRIIALFPSSKVLCYTVYISMALTHLAAVSVGFHSMSMIWDSIFWSTKYRMCCGHKPDLLGVALLLLIPLETFFLGLQLYHNFLQRRVLNGATSSLRILRTIYVDGTLYFFVVFVMRLWTGLMVLSGPSTLFYLSIYAEYAFTSTAMSRLFLHLRSVALTTEQDEPSQSEAVAVSTILVGPHPREDDIESPMSSRSFTAHRYRVCPIETPTIKR